MAGVERWVGVLEQAGADGLPVATPPAAHVPRLLLGIGRVPEALRRLRPLAVAPTTVRTTVLHAVRAGAQTA
jgi:hypothetical protein